MEKKEQIEVLVKNINDKKREIESIYESIYTSEKELFSLMKDDVPDYTGKFICEKCGQFETYVRVDEFETDFIQCDKSTVMVFSGLIISKKNKYGKISIQNHQEFRVNMKKNEFYDDYEFKEISEEEFYKELANAYEEIRK